MKESLNFEMLRSQWPELAELGAVAENYLYSDPESTLVKLRNYLEQVVRWIYRKERLPEGYRPSLFDLLDAEIFRTVVPEAIRLKMTAIRTHGNKAAHGDKVRPKDASWLLQEAFTVGAWLYMLYGNGSAETLGKFRLPEPPAPEPAPSPARLKEKQAQLDKALEELEAVQKREVELLRKLKQEKEKADEIQQRQQQLRERNEEIANTLELDEAQTRRRLIDASLIGAGWDVAENCEDTLQVTQEHPVQEQPTNTGNGYADYVLWDAQGKPLAVIEAKRTREDAEKGRTQARLYADWLEKHHGQRPVIFYTNGYDIYLWDDHKKQGYAPRKLFGFYSPHSLQYLVQQRETRKSLTDVAKPKDIAGRLYQLETLTRVAERFSEKKRKALIVQATGTGKTRVAIGLSKMLLDARWAKRVLFLCDRKELRKQAGKAFNEHLNDPICIVGKSDKKTQQSARIFIATYPGMLRIMDQFDVGYFDLIIADESHRSIYNVYGDLFKYFDALQVGLTATPVDMVGRTTFGLFGCEDRMPTANYSLEDAIDDNNLVPYEIVTHTTRFLREGIQKDKLTDEQLAQLEDQGIDPNTLEFDSKAIDKAIYNKDTNRAIVRNLMENGLRDKDGQLPGKSIIFARNHRHAMLLLEMFEEQYTEFGGKFCQVIDNYDPRAEQLIDDFKATDNNANQLTIAISVDMLDTGIDVPEVVNLVFAKPVKSKVKFWQMIGRGTRLCEDLYGPGKHKQKFCIFDHWGNFDYFDMDPPEADPTTTKSLAQKRLDSWIALAAAAQKKFDQDCVNSVAQLMKHQIEGLPENTIAVKEKWQLREQLSELKRLQQLAPITRQQLTDEMGPLMQWLDIRGQGKAVRFDMLMIEAQTCLYTNPEQITGYYTAVYKLLDKLPPHMAEVQQRGELINQLRELEWWQSTDFTSLEQARLKLRPLMHLLEDDPGGEPVKPIIVDIKEDAAEFKYDTRKSNLKSVDFKLYRQQVQGVLEPLFNSNPVLDKIRRGEPVNDNEIDELAKLVLVQNPNVDIRVLQQFYPDATARLDQILRTLTGMDSEAVASHFADFAASQNLNSQQIRFLDLLKNHIRDFGTIEMAQLFEQPFTHIHGEGVGGVFPDMDQLMAIKQLVDQITVTTGEAAL